MRSKTEQPDELISLLIDLVVRVEFDNVYPVTITHQDAEVVIIRINGNFGIVILCDGALGISKNGDRDVKWFVLADPDTDIKIIAAEFAGHFRD